MVAFIASRRVFAPLLFIAALIVLAGACGGDDYIVNPDSSESANLTDGESPLFASKGGGMVTVCHFPRGNPGNFQIVTVGPKAAAKHILRHPGDGFVGTDYNESCEPLPPVTLVIIHDGAGTGGGTVTSVPPGLCRTPPHGDGRCDCTSVRCEGVYPSGSTVLLELTADPGSFIAGGSGPCAGVSGLFDTCTVVMDGDQTVTIRFDR